MYKKLTALVIMVAFMTTGLMIKTFDASTNIGYLEAGQEQGSYTIKASTVYGNIYDCNLKSLVNNSTKYIAVINPDSDSVKKILPYVCDNEEFYSKLSYGKPFCVEVEENDISDTNGITILEVPNRYTTHQIAPHIIGYSREGQGVSGLELSYSDFLQSKKQEYTVTYNIDGQGNVLNGLDKSVTIPPDMVDGVVSTIDCNIQQICQNAMSDVEKGVAIVIEPKTGAIRALVSNPSYEEGNISLAIDEDNSPLINRALYSYSTGSIFKLVVSMAALKNGIGDDFTHDCKGYCDVDGQTFKCHRLSGHGEQNLEQAIDNSCNTYFIELGKELSNEELLTAAQVAGFGTRIQIAPNIIASSGNVQNENDMKISAEKANFCFGQGKLLSTPLQIAEFTCSIANAGKKPSATLIEGFVIDGELVKEREENIYTNVMSREIANKLGSYMTSAVNDVDGSCAKSSKVMISAKTSTAQTGRLDENGNELTHAWITGFFPSDSPKYVVTVLVEDGGSGNMVAGPIMREISEKITDFDY